MRRSVTAIAVVTALLASETAADAQPRSAQQRPITAALDSAVRAAFGAAEPGAAVIVVRNGEVLYRGAAGMADLELGVSLRPEHVFRIGSVTKQFTGAAILLLAQDGKLSLSDPITRFLPDYPVGGRTVTIEHLLAHTSGIRSYTDLPVFWRLSREDVSVDSLIALFKDEEFVFEPGERWAYNNSGYVLLGAIIERASGVSYADFVRTRIFEPLGMRATTVGDNERIIPNRVPGYAQVGDGWKNAEYLSMTGPYSAGALLSTVDDLSRWANAIFDSELLTPASWRRALSSFARSDGVETRYAAGWATGTIGPHATVEHGGGINGFASHVVLVPEQRLFVAVLGNAEPPRTSPDDLSIRLATLVLGVPLQRPEVQIASERLDDYVGVYTIDGGGTRTITRDGNTLYSQRSGGSRLELYPVGEDRFGFRTSPSEIVFTRENGRVTAMELIPRVLAGDRARRTGDVPPEDPAPPAVALTADQLERYVGMYTVTPSFEIAITRDGERLFAQATGQPRITLIPISEQRFRIREVDAEIEFNLEASSVTGLTLFQAGQTIPATRKR